MTDPFDGLQFIADCMQSIKIAAFLRLLSLAEECRPPMPTKPYVVLLLVAY
jgi:hypothetical protein